VAHRPLWRSRATALLLSVRPDQWTKNLLVFAGVLFGHRLFELPAFARAVAAFGIFCALSGAIYLLNDVADRDRDRRHPAKRRRPIASGELPATIAIGAAVVLGAAGLAGALALGWHFFLVAAGYVGLLSLYSGPLKHIVIIDVLVIAFGFVLRAVAGAVAVDVESSHWLLVCTLLLALFVALAKRRHELVNLDEEASRHRPSLREYDTDLLDQMIAIVTASTLIAYVFYTISPETQQRFGTAWLGLTIPFPLYGIFRYLYIVHRRDGSGSPADLLLTDRPLLACVVLWALAAAFIIYRPR
jgi:4-hydroxybenzoate polyprenyltransferase